MDRLLLTGGSGLLALNWAARLRESCDVVLALHEREVSLRGVDTRWMDLSKPDAIVDALEAIRPHLVVHTAALTSIERCEAEPELARTVNAQLPANVARSCASLGIDLVHISTDHLFAGLQPFLDESAPPSPLNVYAETKALAESLVLDAHPSALVVRTNFYGWGPSYRPSFSDVVINGLRAGRELSLFEDVFYTPIAIGPLIRATHGLVASAARGIYHIVGDERISKYAFGLSVARAFGMDATLVRASRLSEQHALVQRPLEMSLSNEKARRTLQRPLGGVDEHLMLLRDEADTGLAHEIQSCGVRP